MKTAKKLDFRMDSRLCKACGICYTLCPQEVLAADAMGKPMVANADKCILCKLCEYRCPDFAIRVEGIEA